MARAQVLAAALLLGAGARAAEIEHGKLWLNGNGGWAYGVTNTNVFDMGSAIADPSGQFKNAEFNLTITATPAEHLKLAAQLFFDEAPEGGAAGMDWAFAEYTFLDAAKLRAGKIRLPFGLSTEVEAIGTLRPFYELPPSVYGPTDIAGEGYFGIGFTGALYLSRESGWGLGYDVYGGLLETETAEPFKRLINPQPGTPLRAEPEQVRNLLGARLTVFTPVEGLIARASAYRGDLPDTRVYVWALSTEYVSEVWSLRAELVRTIETETSLAGYLEVARRLTPHWQIAALGEFVSTRFPGVPSDSQYLYHRQAALGLNYWVTPGFVVKLAGHLVRGNRLVFPTLLEQAIAAGSVRETTAVCTFGVQFSF